MSDNGVNKGRRRLLTATTAVVGAAGAGLAALPFIQSWQPSAKAKVVGAPVEFNLEPIAPGQILKGQWRGKTVGILRRTPEMLDSLPELTAELKDPDSSDENQQPSYAQNEIRSIKPEYLVLVMNCTHLGCVPELVPEVGPQPFDQNWLGGFYCPCHKSRFDLSGRVYSGVPAQLNLLVPPYHFLDDRTLVVGVDPQPAA